MGVNLVVVDDRTNEDVDSDVFRLYDLKKIARDKHFEM